jgi:peptidoglycan-N-acetylglucosamine deacetylase
MLNYRNTMLISAIVLAGMAGVTFFRPVPIWLFIGIVIAAAALMVYGSISVQAGFYLKSVCTGNTGEPAIAISFDDGPDEKITPAVLDILKKHNVKAAFFVMGSKAARYPEIIRRIDAEGHIIGGHSFSHHFFFDLFGAAKMKKELKTTEDMLRQITGKKTRFFRPPYGVTNPALAKAVKAMNYLSIGWSLKSKDTVIHDEKAVIDRLRNKLRRGDIVLFHDNRPTVLNVLDAFITHVEDRQYRIDRLDKLIKSEAYGTN